MARNAPFVLVYGGSGNPPMNELLAIIGTSWRPLLIFPGLLTGLLLTLTTSYLWKHTRQDENDLAVSTGGLWGWSSVVGQWSAMILMLAFLPVPGSNWRYGVDVLVALALVEVPHWYALRRRLGAANGAIRAGAAAEAAATLNGYVLLGLAIAAIGQANSSLVLGELRGGNTPLRWAGIVVWALALPPLLTLGPWNVVGAPHSLATLRRVAHIGLPVTLALPADADYRGLAIAALMGFGSLALLDRFWHGSPEKWERVQPVIALVMLGVLLYTGATTWYARAR